MAKTTRLVKSFTRLMLPTILLVLIAVVAGSVWLVYATSRPFNSRYLVTPDKYGQLSSRAAQVTEEKWTNRDGSQARGWLLRGAEGAPAVILLHKFGADRSYVLNLGVKLNESTNFTVLMPDQRAHGENPPVKNASFGGCEGEDASSSVEFVRGLKTPEQVPLVGRNLGVFGVEMGALVAITMAARDPGIKAIAVDSVPQDSDSVLRETVDRRYPFASFATTKLARLGTYMYYFDGCYRRESVCDIAKKIESRNVLLLSGLDAQEFQDSTARLAKCFPANNAVETKLDLSPSGFGIINASIEQSEAYDQRLIDFFRNSLSN
jgi:pimeloyl-ACP methyl ester carboxylesterase